MDRRASERYCRKKCMIIEADERSVSCIALANVEFNQRMEEFAVTISTILL